MFGGTPTLVIPWHEVIDIVAQGCTDERREAYEAAFAQWNEWAAEEGYRVTAKRLTDEEIEARYRRWSAVSDGIHAITTAIIEDGCEREPVQPELF